MKNALRRFMKSDGWLGQNPRGTETLNCKYSRFLKQEKHAMRNPSSLPRRMLPVMGTIMILAWTFIIGPLGGMLIGAAAYFMLAENIVAVAICVAVLLLPVVLTITWGCGAWAEVILHNEPDTAADVLKNQSTGPLSLTQGIK